MKQAESMQSNVWEHITSLSPLQGRSSTNTGLLGTSVLDRLTVTHNDWDLSQELETTPPPKKTTTPPAPPDHIFSSITADLQQAFPDNDANTTVDTINNKVSVKYLYDKEKLLKLDENFFGATKRASVLHYNIFPKPDIASGMD